MGKLLLSSLALILSISATSHVFGSDNTLKLDDLDGYFHISIDIGGPYRKGEIYFNKEMNSCHFKWAAIDSILADFKCKYSMGGTNLFLNLQVSEQNESADELLLTIDLARTDRSRILNTIEDADPNEKKERGSSASVFGSPIIIYGLHTKNDPIPYRIIKLPLSFFGDKY